MRSLCDYLHDPEHIAVCITEGIPNSLKQLLSDKDSFCRYKSAECLYVLSCEFKLTFNQSSLSFYLLRFDNLGNSNGRKAIIDQNIIPTLAVLFDDTEALARKNSHKTVEMVSEFPFGKLFIFY